MKRWSARQVVWLLVAALVVGLAAGLWLRPIPDVATGESIENSRWTLPEMDPDPGVEALERARRLYARKPFGGRDGSDQALAEDARSENAAEADAESDTAVWRFVGRVSQADRALALFLDPQGKLQRFDRGQAVSSGFRLEDFGTDHAHLTDLQGDKDLRLRLFEAAQFDAAAPQPQLPQVADPDQDLQQEVPREAPAGDSA